MTRTRGRGHTKRSRFAAWATLCICMMGAAYACAGTDTEVTSTVGTGGTAPGGTGGATAGTGGTAGGGTGGGGTGGGGTGGVIGGAGGDGGAGGAADGGATAGGATAGGATAGGAAGGSAITEADLDQCAQTSDCIVVAYSHCCGATKRAINSAYEAAYDAHPEWQVFNDPATCAVIGACMDDSAVTEATCSDAPDGYCQLVFP